MAKIAVIKTGGKQYKVEKGKTIKIEKLDTPVEKKINFDTLLVASTDTGGKEFKLGQPLLKQKVEGKVVEQGKDKKISVIKYKRKTRYLKNKGHRQAFTKVKIISIAPKS